MNSIFLVTRLVAADNDMQYDSERGTDFSEQRVGAYLTREEAEARKALIDTYAGDERGTTTWEQEDQLGDQHSTNFDWWQTATACTITEVLLGDVAVTAPDPVARQASEDLAAQRAQEQADSKELERQQAEATKLFVELGSKKHMDKLGWYLALAGCRSMADVLAIGAEEFASNKGARFWMEYGYHSDTSEAKQALRDFKDSLRYAANTEIIQAELV